MLKSGNIPKGDEGMDYISFGSGAETLVLAVTLARQNETIREAVGAWIDMLKYPILTREGKPESFDFRNRR